MNSIKSSAIATFLMLTFGLIGCAIQVPMSPITLEVVASTEQSEIVMNRTVEFMLDTAYKRTVVGNTRWKKIGLITTGEVYRPVDSIFTVEASHTHEAYLVLKQEMLVGFYLPADKAFVKQSVPVKLFFTHARER